MEKTFVGVKANGRFSVFENGNYQFITEKKVSEMIENKNEADKNPEKALQALEQAKQRVANEKKRTTEKLKQLTEEEFALRLSRF